MCFRTTGDRQYDLPTSNEVAAVFTQNANGDVDPAHLVVHSKGGSVLTLSTISEHVDPFTFPLLFPRGERGWRPYVPYNGGDIRKRKFISRREFVCARLAVREGVFNPLHHAGKLMQEYVVVQYVHVESDRVQWIRNNQETLRATDYTLYVCVLVIRC